MSVVELVKRGGCLVLAAMLFGGCTVGYTVDVRNDTSQPVGVALMRGSASGQPGTLAQQRIGPGSRAQVSRFGLSSDLQVYVEADAQGNGGYPAQMDLKPGLTVVRVTQDGNLPTGKMHLEKVDP